MGGDPFVMAETFKEVQACRKAGIMINTFMLASDYYRRFCKTDVCHDEWQSLFRQPRQSVAIRADRFSPSQDPTSQVVFANASTESPMRNRVLLPYSILLLGFCFTLLVYYYFSVLIYDQDRLRFDSSVQEIQDQVRLRIATSTALLRAGTGLFAASDFVDAHEFESFVTQIELDKNYPGVEGIGYSARFTPEDKAQVVAGMHRQGFREFRIWPDDAPRSEYNSIMYLQPDSIRNKGAIGYDMGTNETRRQAMEAARDTGKPVASG